MTCVFAWAWEQGLWVTLEVFVIEYHSIKHFEQCRDAQSKVAVTGIM